MKSKLKRYIVSADVTVSVMTEVEAKSPAEAKKIAAGRCLQSLCIQCASGETMDEEWVTSGELDGVPQNLRCGP